MKHLTINEIIDFVSMMQTTEASLRLASRVNGHIMHCDKCLDLVRSFQDIYDELAETDRAEAFRSAAAEEYHHNTKFMDAER